LTDVVALYGNEISAVETHAEFIDACSSALTKTAHERGTLNKKMRARLRGTSWDLTVAQMLPLLRVSTLKDSVVARGLLRNAETEQNRKSEDDLAAIKNDEADTRPYAVDAIILGAGPTGLSAAFHLGKSTLLLERSREVGGNCRSIVDHGFTFDYAGHIMFSNDEYVLGMYRKLLGDNIHWQDREAWIFSKGVHTRYPFQGALYGLPPRVLTEC